MHLLAGGEATRIHRRADSVVISTERDAQRDGGLFVPPAVEGRRVALAWHGRVTYAGGMSVDRLSVTVPSKMGAAMRSLARARGQTVSTLVTTALARELRMAALDEALAAADRQFGPVPGELIDQAEAELRRAMARGASRSRRTRR